MRVCKYCNTELVDKGEGLFKCPNCGKSFKFVVKKVESKPQTQPASIQNNKQINVEELKEKLKNKKEILQKFEDDDYEEYKHLEDEFYANATLDGTKIVKFKDNVKKVVIPDGITEFWQMHS